MTSHQQSNLSPDKWKRCVETHEKSMKSAISAQNNFDPDQLNQEHEKFFKILTTGFTKEEKRDLKVMLTERWYNLLKQEEEKTCLISGEQNENNICIYLTYEWVYVVAYTKNLGTVSINFGNEKPGFSARIKQREGNLIWSQNDDGPKIDKPFEVNYFNIHIWYAAKGSATSREVIREVFFRVKESVELEMNDMVSRVLLVTPTNFIYSDRSVLRECCKMAGFKKISVVSECSLAACSVFSKLQTFKKDTSVLILSADNNYITIRIFGCDLNGNDIKGMQLLSAAYCFPISKEKVKSAYKRALGNVIKPETNHLRYYVVFNEFNDSSLEETFDEIFRDEEQLSKADKLCGEKLKEVFSHFTSFKGKNCDDGFASISADNPVVPEDPQECQSVPKPQVAIVKPLSVSENVASCDSSRKPPHVAKLPLKLRTANERTCKIMAFTDWTVCRLKTEFLECLGTQRDSNSMELRYKEKLLSDEDILLDSYNMEPDSLIEVSFVLPSNTPSDVSDGGKTESLESSTKTLKLIGNCVAFKNGTETVNVKGIKPGRLVMSRIDSNNLVMGEVAMTCKINGFEDRIYVGVKFRKQLALGTSGTQIDHIDLAQGYCDKCKGRRSLFIPRDMIGSSNRYLFQVQ